MHYFFSDVHLGLGAREKSLERERSVVRFMEMVGNAPDGSLWIVGDLFDYWFDYRTVIPRGYTRVLGAIARLTDAGIPVEYVIGNHDFGHYSYFEQELGVRVHYDDVERTVCGRRCLIAHGDGKVAGDNGYLMLKKVLRARLSNMLFRLIHPDAGIGLAAWSSRNSRAYTSAKPYGERNSLLDFADKHIAQRRYDLVIMGHNHSPLHHRTKNGEYVNLGAWLGGVRTYLAMDSQVCELRNWE